MFYKITKLTLFYYIYMIVLESSVSNQTFDFIPREYTDSVEQIYNVSIISETQNVEVYSQNTATFPSNDYYRTYTDVFTLVENNFYILTIKKNNDVIFKDKIFCTNQAYAGYWETSLDYWDLVEGVWEEGDNNYKHHQSNNEFIVV